MLRETCFKAVNVLLWVQGGYCVLFLHVSANFSRFVFGCRGPGHLLAWSKISTFVHIFHYACAKQQTLDLEAILKAQNIEEPQPLSQCWFCTAAVALRPPSGGLVEANCLLTFVFLHLHITCVVWFFLCPPLLSLAASGLQKQGDITTNGRRGGEERWTEQKKGERAIIKCPCQQ